MARPQVRTSNSVSLFPFLAVLICAMGALIFLLVVTTRRIRHHAVIRAMAEEAEKPDQPLILAPDAEPDSSSRAAMFDFAAVEAPVPPLTPPKTVDPNASLRELIASLLRQRDDDHRQNEERLIRLTAAQTRLNDTNAKLDKLRKNFKPTQERRLTNSVNRQVTRAELIRLSDQIEKTQRQLLKIRQQNATRSSKFTIVAFDGQSGTTRRPILIECTKDGLKFLQEEIMLTAADLDGFTVVYNPLLAGARALVKHWKRQSLLNDRDDVDPEPYILLIVRPGGSIAYYAARKMLSQLGQPTGYELVQAGRDLDIPPSDPQATASCREAIEQVLSERQGVIDSIVASGREQSGLLRFRRGPDGLEPIDPERPFLSRGGRSQLSNRNATRNSGRFPRTTGGGRPGAGSRQQADRLAAGFGRPGDQQPRNGFRQGGSGRNGVSGQSVGDPLIGRTGSRLGSAGQRDGQTGSSRFGDPQGTNRGGLTPASRRQRGGLVADASSGRQSSGKSFGNGSNAPTSADNRNNRGGSSASRGSNSAGRPSGQNGNQPGQNGGQPGLNGGQPGLSSHQPPNPFPIFGQSRSARRGRASNSPRAWGIGSTRNGIGFERETVVLITPDLIRVGTQPSIRLDVVHTTDELVQRLLHDLDRHARTWGNPPKGFYWVPIVRFRVSPGGNQFYERLHGPLRKWGIGSSAEYPLDTPLLPARAE